MADGEVIDWDEAMEQCGGDEEFLIELLGDLEEELDTQVKKIGEALVSMFTHSLSNAFIFKFERMYNT